ncbi:ProQ/FINO family protein [Rosenbergiella epipactidis]|uniref:ProQ/FINO family protein n=1 Tax=Rosenbergiella epipactidis TaxID=1544694 RepID=UPI001F4E529B|nr:ProQ/FinO family protein [Rosenbergiella epipactidis]
MSRDHTLEQVAEMARQAEIICRLWEDHPHHLEDCEHSALATLVRRLSGNVAAWLIEEQAEKSKKKMKKNAKHKHKQMLRLISIFPALLSEEEPKPFKVGILEDMTKYIADNQITFGIGQVKSALARYTSNYRYQKALAAGGDRYDLDGNPCGEVTPEQQAAAKEKTKAIKAVYNGKG